MTEEAKSTATIQDLSYDFACRIVRLYQYLTDPNDVIFDSSFEEGNAPHKTHHTPHEREFIMSKQVVRSGTSIGANVREAQHGQSDADFYAKMSIALKEADETQYWQSLLHDNGYISDFQFASLDQDIQRILLGCTKQ